MIAIIDYGVGNLYSLKSSLDSLGISNMVTRLADKIKNADKLILPGVGAFGDAVKSLHDSGLYEIVCNEAKNGKPIMGICLGMQMLFEKSYEYGEHTGLGLIPGKIIPIVDVVDNSYKIPHIGWNALSFTKNKSPIYKYVNDGECVYFVHSYYATECCEYITATCEYGAQITASVQNKNIFGCQFHPEKSGRTGLNILRAFSEYSYKEGECK